MPSYVLQPLWQAASDLFPALRPRLDQLLFNAAYYSEVVTPPTPGEGVGDAVSPQDNDGGDAGEDQENIAVGQDGDELGDGIGVDMVAIQHVDGGSIASGSSQDICSPEKRV